MICCEETGCQEAFSLLEALDWGLALVLGCRFGVGGGVLLSARIEVMEVSSSSSCDSGVARLLRFLVVILRVGIRARLAVEMMSRLGCLFWGT